MNTKPKCFNRPDYTDFYMAQHGWIKKHTTAPFTPVFRKIKNAMSKDCKQNDVTGAATIYKWDCKGCKHYVKNI